MYSGITSGRVLDRELLYTKILEVNLFAFAYRLFHEDLSPIDGTLHGTHSMVLILFSIYLFFERLARSPSNSTFFFYLLRCVVSQRPVRL